MYNNNRINSRKKGRLMEYFFQEFNRYIDYKKNDCIFVEDIKAKSRIFKIV